MTQPTTRSETIRLDVYKPHPRNYNRHPAQQIERIAQSLQKFGQIRNVVVWRGYFLAGHGVAEAARGLGWETLEANILPNEYPEHLALGYLAADNELGRQSDPDQAALAAILEELREVDPELLPALGFSAQEAEKLLSHFGERQVLEDPGPELDRLGELQQKWQTGLGQLWALGEHRLLCGDATDEAAVQQLLAGEQPVLMVTDPPYGVEYDPSWRADAGINQNTGKLGVVVNDDRVDWSAAYRLSQAQVCYIWHAGKYSEEVARSIRDCGYAIVAQIIWVKDRFALSRGDYHWQHEPCWYAVRQGETHNWQGARDQSTVWQIARADDAGHGHGTQKPLECMVRPIQNNTGVGDLVYEPFCGSGTTLIACEQLRRRCRAIEIAPEYVAVALERWSTMTQEKPTLV